LEDATVVVGGGVDVGHLGGGNDGGNWYVLTNGCVDGCCELEIIHAVVIVAVVVH